MTNVSTISRAVLLRTEFAVVVFASLTFVSNAGCIAAKAIADVCGVGCTVLASSNSRDFNQLMYRINFRSIGGDHVVISSRLIFGACSCNISINGMNSSLDNESAALANR